MILEDVQRIQPKENGEGKLNRSKTLLMLLILIQHFSSACKKLVKSHKGN